MIAKVDAMTVIITLFTMGTLLTGTMQLVLS